MVKFAPPRCLEKWYDVISRDCSIDSMWPVLHNKKEQQMFKKTPNYFTYKIKYHMYNQLSIKKRIYVYTTLNLYIHPAETHRLLKFLFHSSCRPIISLNVPFTYTRFGEILWSAINYCLYSIGPSISIVVEGQQIFSSHHPIFNQNHHILSNSEPIEIHFEVALNKKKYT